jgi:adenine/guanine phosphoribosyltransferase-like PRPP-binding protein
MPSIPAPLTEAGKAAKSRLKTELSSAQVVAMGDYAYVTHPVLDGFPSLDVDFVTALASACVDMPFADRAGAKGVHGVITVEAMGIPLAFDFAKEIHAPLHIARKKEYKVQGEIVVRRKTGYSESNLSFNGLDEGKTYWFVDSLFSSGATLKAAMLALKLAGAKLGGSVFLVSKMDEAGAQKLSQMTGAPLWGLVTLSIMDASAQTGGEAHGFRVRVTDGFSVKP